MIFLNIQNIEDLIFNNHKIRNLLPDLRHIIDQWTLSKYGMLRSLKLRSLADMLNSLTPEHIKLLEKHFCDTIAIDKIDYNIVKNIIISLEPNEIEKVLPSFNGFDNIAISRDAKQLYISFWR
jgi:hypothetical protein